MVDCWNKTCIGKWTLQSKGQENWERTGLDYKTWLKTNWHVLEENTRVVSCIFNTGWTKTKYKDKLRNCKHVIKDERRKTTITYVKLCQTYTAVQHECETTSHNEKAEAMVHLNHWPDCGIAGARHNDVVIVLQAQHRAGMSLQDLRAFQRVLLPDLAHINTC